MAENFDIFKSIKTYCVHIFIINTIQQQQQQRKPHRMSQHQMCGCEETFHSIKFSLKSVLQLLGFYDFVHRGNESDTCVQRRCLHDVYLSLFSLAKLIIFLMTMLVNMMNIYFENFINFPEFCSQGERKKIFLRNKLKSV